MARQPRFFVSGSVLHISRRGNNREPNLASDEDLRFFLSCVAHARDRHELGEFVVRGHSSSNDQRTTINEPRSTTNKNLALGNERFKRQIEELAGRRASPARRGPQPASSSANRA
jgi:hypothetical protein